MLPRRTVSLSRGTVDQLYLAVRLAVCELALPAEEPAPLVLDDALSDFDDARMALALECLEQYAGERQILALHLPWPGAGLAGGAGIEKGPHSFGMGAGVTEESPFCPTGGRGQGHGVW